jgi:PAS domain S-box-containing protein
VTSRMTPQIDSNVSRKLARFVLFCSVLAVAFGLFVLIGWAFHLETVKQIIPGQVAVKANTAVCFILIGFALWAAKKTEPTKLFPWNLVAGIAASVAAVVGLLSLLEGIFGWHLGIDQVLFRAGPEDLPGSLRSGLMSPVSAFGFLLLGLSILLLDTKIRAGRWLIQLLPSAVAVASMFGILDFALEPVTTHTYISPITALVLFLLSFAVLLASPGSDLGALIASGGSGGALTRQLLPAAIMVPLLVAWLRWKGQAIGLYSDWTGLAMMTVFTVTLLAGFTVWTGFLSKRSEVARLQQEESVARLASIVTSSTDAITAETLEGIVTDWNPGADAIYGYSAEEMVGRSIAVMIPPNHSVEHDTNMQRIREGKRVPQFETERVRKDGTIVDVSVSINPVKDSAGGIVGASTIARDITDRKRTRDELHLSRERLALALKAGRSGTFDWDIRKNINRWSPETEALYGLAPGTFGGTYEDWESLVVPEDLGPARAAIEDSLKVGEFASEWRIRQRKDGQIRWIDARAKVLFDEDGNPNRMMGINVDVTERKQVEEKLKIASEYTRSLIEASLDPLVTISRDGKITDVNQAAEKATGISRDQLIGSDFCGYFTEPEQARAGYQQAFAEGTVCDYPLAIRGKSGAVTEVLYNASVFKNQAGEVEGVFAAARDVTERKRAEKELALRAEELARSNADLQQFAYVASHDLQEPLRMVASYTQLLGKRYRGKLDADADDFIGYAVDGAHRMQQLVNDLLAYSRVGTRAREFAPIECESVLRAVLGNLKAAIEETRAVISHDGLPAVQADETQLGQIFQNLIGNALKFHGADVPRVHISVRRQDGEWCFSVRDNGIGIDPHDADRIFVIFQRLHAGREYAGTGIGLAITKKIVERHGGRIWVESTPGQGSTFIFTIPMTEVVYDGNVRAFAGAAS